MKTGIVRTWVCAYVCVFGEKFFYKFFFPSDPIIHNFSFIKDSGEDGIWEFWVYGGRWDLRETKVVGGMVDNRVFLT
jgi:hypothetical protein